MKLTILLVVVSLFVAQIVLSKPVNINRYDDMTWENATPTQPTWWPTGNTTDGYNTTAWPTWWPTGNTTDGYNTTAWPTWWPTGNTTDGYNTTAWPTWWPTGNTTDGYNTTTEATITTTSSNDHHFKLKSFNIDLKLNALEIETKK